MHAIVSLQLQTQALFLLDHKLNNKVTTHIQTKCEIKKGKVQNGRYLHVGAVNQVIVSTTIRRQSCVSQLTRCNNPSELA